MTPISTICLRDSVRLRLRADVPVGTYLSGGLDSSLITALAQAETDHELRTFSIAFADPRYDERSHQEEVARAIGTRHHVVNAGPAEIADAFPDVVRHAEMPLVRTAPVPLFLLAREVRASGITVVATGEGADELFWGYELFKEVALRELHAAPAGTRSRAPRAALLLPRPGGCPPRAGLAPLPVGDRSRRRGAGLPSHARGGNLHCEGLLSAGDRGSALQRAPRSAASGPSCHPASRRWSPLERAAWLEIATLLDPYLLSAQGDRVAMAHGVEGRLSVPRPSRFRALRAPAARGEARRTCVRRSPSAGWRQRCCRPRSPSEASSHTVPPR